MTGDQWGSIITAFFGGMLALMAAFPAFYLAMRNAFKPVVVTMEKIPVAIDLAAATTAVAITKNTEVLEGPIIEKLDEVHLATNSTLEKATKAEEASRVKLDEVIAERDAGTLLTLEGVRHQLDESKAEIAAARAEIVRLNAEAAPRGGA